ncbi:hypothetical protein ACHAQH_002002 [Verticillium albo-atrum]
MPMRASEGSVHDSSSDDSDWEELDLKAEISRAKRLLNKYKTGQNPPRPVSLPTTPPAAPPPSQAPKQQSPPPPPLPPGPRLLPPGMRGFPLPSGAATAAPLPRPLTSQYAPPPPPPPPPPFNTRPRVPPLIPPPLPVRLTVHLPVAASPGPSHLKVLTTLPRASLRALLDGAIACVDGSGTGRYRAKARRARFDGVVCDMGSFAADDLGFFFRKGDVPFFEVAVWREGDGDDDDDDDDDESEIAD